MSGQLASHLWCFPGSGGKEGDRWVGENKNKDHLIPDNASKWVELGNKFCNIPWLKMLKQTQKGHKSGNPILWSKWTKVHILVWGIWTKVWSSID